MMNIHYDHIIENHRRETDYINREGWKISNITKKIVHEKQFCFTFVKKWCISVRYS